MNKVREAINDIKLMLNDNPKLTLESFYLPENFDETMMDDDVPVDDNHVPHQQPKEQPQESSKIGGIEKELTQIRKIALNVITRLADQPSSEQYQLMKKIWDTVDKAIENSVKNINPKVN